MSSPGVTEPFYVCSCVAARVPAPSVEEIRGYRPIVEVDGNVTTWTCPLCGTRMLTAIDGGTLGLGLVRDEDLRPDSRTVPAEPCDECTHGYCRCAARAADYHAEQVAEEIARCKALAGPGSGQGPVAGSEAAQDTPACDHEWVQEHGTSGRYCVLCGAGPDTPDYRMRFVWLIERGQSLNHAPTVWLCQEKPYDFSPDPLRAIRYPTREAAEVVIAEHTVGARSPWAVAVEHGFADTPADRQEDKT